MRRARVTMEGKKKKEKYDVSFSAGRAFTYTVRTVFESERIFCLYGSLLDVLLRRHPG